MTEALQQLVEKACRFNCDAESSCSCHAHELYREMAAEQEALKLRLQVTEESVSNCAKRVQQLVAIAAVAGGGRQEPMKAEDRALCVTRLEVIGEDGRLLTRRPCEIELSFQDNDRTLKVFVRGGRAAAEGRDTTLPPTLTALLQQLGVALDEWDRKDGGAAPPLFRENAVWGLVRAIVAEARKTAGGDTPQEPPRLESALRKAKTFIEYARYELQPGKAQFGDQFPKQVDADVVIALIDSALEAREARAVPPLDSCQWREDEDGIYQTACGHSFTFDTDGPRENGGWFCFYCGKHLEPVKFVEPALSQDQEAT